MTAGAGSGASDPLLKDHRADGPAATSREASPGRLTPWLERLRGLLSFSHVVPGGVESAIKNNIEDVRLFLDSKHPRSLAVYNLSPRTYRPSSSTTG